MTTAALERHQLWIYLAAIVAGLALGTAAPAGRLEPLIWPLLAALLYATFLQAGLSRLGAAFGDLRFLGAALAGNFVILPLLVAGVLALAPADPAIRLGLALVLLVPCTDWFVTFTQLAGGDARRAIAILPALLVAQMLLLPLCLRLLVGADVTGVVPAGPVLAVFIGIIALPLLAALLTARWAARRPARAAAIRRAGALPVPLLAGVLFLVAASQVETVARALPLLPGILLACVVFLAGATASALAIGRILRLPVPQARTLVFTMTTRNSFVVLPFALALPAGWEIAPVVIVFQSLIELFAMLAMMWLVPHRLLVADPAGTYGAGPGNGIP